VPFCDIIVLLLNKKSDDRFSWHPKFGVLQNQLHELNVSQHGHHNYCNEWFNALDGQIHDIHDMLNSFQTRNDPQDDWVCWLFRIIHYIHEFVLFQFQLCQFQLVVFIFRQLIISALCLFSLFSVPIGCILFDESKGGENLKKGKLITLN